MKIFMLDKKCLGQYDEQTDTLHKWGVKKSKHLYKKSNSWGLDIKMIKALFMNTKVVIHETEERKDYHSTVAKILENGHYYHYKKKDDHGTQIFLSLDNWIIK